MILTDNPEGNYQFLTGIAPYSSGVVAMPGYEIVHVSLRQPLAYRQGFELIANHLAAQGRSRRALCAIELRSPRPFTFDGFAAFNQDYREILLAWNLLVDGQNPVARTNVAPEMYPPDEPVLHAFSFTIPADGSTAVPTFVVAGAGDLLEGTLSAEMIIRPGETSVEAMREKAAYVLGEMEARLTGLQAAWADITCLDIYTVHSLQPFLALTILKAAWPAAVKGLHWYYSRPPIMGLEFEMDMRGVRQELWL